MEKNMRFFHLVRVRRPDGLKWRYTLHKEIAPNFEGINKIPGPEYVKVLAWLAAARHGEVKRAGDCLILAVDHAVMAEAWERGEYSPYASPAPSTPPAAASPAPVPPVAPEPAPAETWRPPVSPPGADRAKSLASFWDDEVAHG